MTVSPSTPIIVGVGQYTERLGAPDMYFGDDRLPLIREALARHKERAA